MLVKPTPTANIVLANLPELVKSRHLGRTYYWLRVATGPDSAQLIGVTATALPNKLGKEFHARHPQATGY